MKSISLKKVLLYSFILETVCVTYALYIKSLTEITSILFTISGLVMVYCFLKIPIPTTNSSIDISPLWKRYRILLTAIALIAISGAAYKWIQDAPMDYHDGDMLPIIKIMNERFISGAWSHVYDIIPEIWNGIQPIYLPAMWLPFSIPVFLGIDLRWMTVVSLFIVAALFLFRINPRQPKAPYLFLSAFCLLWWLISAENSGLIPYTEEGVVILFYSLLAIALSSKNVWFLGLATSLCILSRYAIVGWLPAMLFYFTFNKDWKYLYRFCITGISCFILLVLIPFGWSTFVKLASIPSAYIAFTKRVWDDAPVVFRESLGWAKFFGPQNITLQHTLLVSLALTVPTLFIVVTLLLQKKYSLTNQHIPFAALKLTLVVFYTLVDVPFLYLFYTGSFVSLFLVTYLLAGVHSIKASPVLN